MKRSLIFCATAIALAGCAVKDPAVLDKVKPGDKVRFAADKAGSGFIVTEIEAAK